MSKELEQRVQELEQTVERLTKALDSARVIKTGSSAARTFPEDDYYLHLPKN